MDRNLGGILENSIALKTLHKMDVKIWNFAEREPCKRKIRDMKTDTTKNRLVRHPSFAILAFFHIDCI